MIAYLQMLNRQLEEQKAQRAQKLEAERATANQAARERLTPVKQRVVRLLATIPPEVQAEGLSLSSLQAQLKGRWRGNAHAGQIGTALRELGFERRRQWTGGPGGYVALWYPCK